MSRKVLKSVVSLAALMSLVMTSSCAWVTAPDARNVNIPSPTMADKRKTAVNERPDSVMYLPLGEDVLVPEVIENDDFPHEFVGPFELRGETLAGALQLILADYDISLGFETEAGLTRRVTVANLRGDLGKVVDQVCSLANLYCAFENGNVVVKDTQTFTVTLPPIGGTEEGEDFLTSVAEGLAAILGDDVPAPIVDTTTRTLVYSATQRTADVAARYFQRLRANTAMIVFETYIWEVSLNSGNSTGIQWDKIATLGKYDLSIDVNGSVGADFLNPVSIGLPTAHEITGSPTNIVNMLSQFGAVKTISQPQITVLSGSEAELRVADTRNYVSQVATTLNEGQSTTSVSTDSVDTGFTLTIGSSWDKSTVYANVEIELTDVKQIDDFSFTDGDGGGGGAGGATTIQLPQTSERQLTTQIRVRPGDSILIAGLVRENDNFDTRGIGFMSPVIPDSRTAQADNLELVILLRPRVVIYTAPNDPRYVDFALKKHKLPGTGAEAMSPKELGEEPVSSSNAPVPLRATPSAPMAIAPAPAAAPSRVAEPVATDVPVVPLTPAPPAASEPVIVAPAPVVPAASRPVPTPSQSDMEQEARFQRGEGFVSRSEGTGVAKKPESVMGVSAPVSGPAASPPSSAALSAPVEAPEGSGESTNSGAPKSSPSVPMFEDDQTPISIFPE